MLGAVADVTDHAALDRVIDEAAEAYGRLDVAFANAGDPSRRRVRRARGRAGQRPRVDGGRARASTDERGSASSTSTSTGSSPPHLAVAGNRRPRWFGRIIVTTSLAATKCGAGRQRRLHHRRGWAPTSNEYIALKLAAPHGPTANAIAPGFFVTNIGGGHAHNPDVQAAIAKDIPMHRVGPARPHQRPRPSSNVARVEVHHRPGYRTIDGGWGLRSCRLVARRSARLDAGAAVCPKRGPPNRIGEAWRESLASPRCSWHCP